MICKCCNKVAINSSLTKDELNRLFDEKIKMIAKSYYKFDEEVTIKYDRFNDEVIYYGSKIKR